MIVTFNRWLLPPASTTQSNATVHGTSPSAKVQLPDEAPHETSLGAPVQSSSGPSRETSPSTPVQPASERTAQVIPNTDVHPPSESAHESSASPPVHSPSELPYQASPSAPVHSPSHRSHEANPSRKGRHSSESSIKGDSGANTPPASSGKMPAATSDDSIPGKESTTNQTVLPGSGNEKDRVLGTETNSRCIALNNGRFPSWLDLSRYTSERRHQWIKNLTCDGDKDKTYLCCRVPTID